MDHLEAKTIVDALGLSLEESLLLRAVAFVETRYGRAWKGEGEGSHNWGAITLPSKNVCPGFVHTDHRFDEATGKVIEYSTCFRIYSSDEEGAQHLSEVLLKPNVKRALSNRDLYGAALAMRENRYYLGTASSFRGQVGAYYDALENAVREITNRTGESFPFGVAASCGFRSLVPLPSSSLEPFVLLREAVSKVLDTLARRTAS